MLRQATSRHIHPWASIACSIALGCLVNNADAAVVCSVTAPLDIPANGEGLYINFVTGITGTAESQVPGFDFDPYASQNSTPANQLKFYWGASSNGGAGVARSGDMYAVLAPGDTIGPSSLFTRAGFTGDTSTWQSGITGGYLGTRFTNEAANILNYGWVHMTTTAPLGFPMTVLDWCYEDNGAAIVVPLPSDLIFCDGFDGGGAGTCTAVSQPF